jgi:membrane dipeptidase
VSEYSAYSYLTPGEDFRGFELAPEFGRVPPYEAGLTEPERERAQCLRDSIVISLHDHPVRFPLRMEETPEYNRTGRQHAGYAGLAASGLTVVFDNMMDGTACVTGNAPWRWDDVITDLGMRQADLAHSGSFMTIRTVADIDEAHRSGRVGLVFGLEAATPIENEIDRLDVLYGLGLRQIGIAYSDANALGSGLAERNDGGLTALGRRAVTRMNKLGLAIDVSHSSDRTALDTCERSDRPVFITHAGARAVWDTPRMKSDDVLRAVAATGSVIGMSAAPHTTLSAGHPRHSIESVMDTSATARTWSASTMWRSARTRSTGITSRCTGSSLTVAARERAQPGRGHRVVRRRSQDMMRHQSGQSPGAAVLIAALTRVAATHSRTSGTWFRSSPAMSVSTMIGSIPSARCSAADSQARAAGSSRSPAEARISATSRRRPPGRW